MRPVQLLLVFVALLPVASWKHSHKKAELTALPLTGGKGKWGRKWDCSEHTTEDDCGGFFCVWNKNENKCQACHEETTEATCTAITTCQWTATDIPAVEAGGICHPKISELPSPDCPTTEQECTDSAFCGWSQGDECVACHQYETASECNALSGCTFESFEVRGMTFDVCKADSFSLGSIGDWGNIDWGAIDWENIDWSSIDWENMDWENMDWADLLENLDLSSILGGKSGGSGGGLTQILSALGGGDGGGGLKDMDWTQFMSGGGDKKWGGGGRGHGKHGGGGFKKFMGGGGGDLGGITKMLGGHGGSGGGGGLEGLTKMLGGHGGSGGGLEGLTKMLGGHGGGGRGGHQQFGGHGGSHKGFTQEEDGEERQRKRVKGGRQRHGHGHGKSWGW